MCIAIFSTAHPDYALVLVSNRDEYLSRPTAPAAWWAPPDDHILSGRDLLRQEHGTWLGITKDGLLAVLTNFREEGDGKQEARSRGAMVNAFLQQPREKYASTEDFLKSLLQGEGLKGVGGFSLVCGRVGEPLAVISNRTPSVEGVSWLAQRRWVTEGLSNAAFGDRSWPKVTNGEKLMKSAIHSSVARNDTKAEFIEEMMRLLSTDTLPKRQEGQSWDAWVKELRLSIFIPKLGGEGAEGMSAEDVAAAKSEQNVQGLSGAYGTQKQTVLLVDHEGRVTFVERTLYDCEAQPIRESERDRWFEFDVPFSVM